MDDGDEPRREPRSQTFVWPLLSVTLLLAALTFGYSFIGEAKVWRRYSEARAALNDWRLAGNALPKDAVDRVDGIILGARSEWRIVRGLSCVISLAAFLTMVFISRKGKR